jgi:hypothetical protein
LDDDGEISLEDAVTPAPALPEPAVVLSFDDPFSDEDSESLADIGINVAARPSDVDWVDWLVVSFIGFMSRTRPMVSTKPVRTATPPRKNLFLYSGSRSIINILSGLLYDIFRTS